MHNNELQNSYFPPHTNLTTLIVWVRHIACRGEMPDVHTFLVAQSE
jgi:hypothetical protein